MPLFDVVIPARDEETTVSGVVRAALAARGVGRVIVVDDGSSDGTAAVAAEAGATVVTASPRGEPGSKARALACGVAASTADVLVFFDADILGVEPVHLEALAAPVLSGEVRLSCGIVDYGALRNPLFLRLPPITGLRALPRAVFAAVPEAKRKGFQIEIMINEVIARGGMASSIRVLGGIRHRSKIAKQGWRRGLPSHLRMTGELLACLRIVPLWTYRAYLRNLRLLPRVAAEGPSPVPFREAESSVPPASP